MSGSADFSRNDGPDVGPSRDLRNVDGLSKSLAATIPDLASDILKKAATLIRIHQIQPRVSTMTTTSRLDLVADGKLYSIEALTRLPNLIPGFKGQFDFSLSERQLKGVTWEKIGNQDRRVPYVGNLEVELVSRKFGLGDATTHQIVSLTDSGGREFNIASRGTTQDSWNPLLNPSDVGRVRSTFILLDNLNQTLDKLLKLAPFEYANIDSAAKPNYERVNIRLAS